MNGRYGSTDIVAIVVIVQVDDAWMGNRCCKNMHMIHAETCDYK